MATAKFSIEIPYEDLGFILAGLQPRVRNYLFKLISRTYDFDIISTSTDKPIKRLTKDIKIELHDVLADKKFDHHSQPESAPDIPRSLG